MDKIKDIFYAVFIKHLFWTLSLVVIAMGLVGWWMSAGKLKGDYDSNFNTVKQTKDTITTIGSKPENQIFNETSHAGMKEMNAQRRLDVYRAWTDKYAKQQKEVLVWPEGLSKKFVSEIEKLLKGRPIEEVEPKTDGTDHLVFQLREEYRNEIKSLLPKLAEMINAEWSPQGGTSRIDSGRSGFGGGVAGEFGRGFGRGFSGRPPVEGIPGETAKPAKEYAVYWNPADQGDIQATHFGFAEAEELPTTPEILYSMEDYWVLKALMQIVARTNTDKENGPALLPHQAAVREIHSIRIGAAVESDLGEVYAAAPTAGAGVEGGAPPVEGAAAPPPPVPGPEGMPEGGATPAGPDPIEGRYVDKSYKPLPAQKVRSAATSEDPAEAYLAVAKRMPVRMRVKIDQRKLNKFLIECGNADLMLEVKQVRINPETSDIFALSGASGRGGAGIGGGRGFGGGGRQFGGEAGVQENDAKYPWDVVVDVYGIIYIFNPPSLKRLTDKLEAEDIAKFEASIKEAAPADASTKPVGETPAGEAGPAATEPAADDAEKAPPAADDEPSADKPPTEAAKVEAPPAGAG